jgi:hypothetical protein
LSAAVYWKLQQGKGHETRFGAGKHEWSFSINHLRIGGARLNLATARVAECNGESPIGANNKKGLMALSAEKQLQERMEARVGIEPTHKGFADLSLTTWVPRPRH